MLTALVTTVGVALALAFVLAVLIGLLLPAGSALAEGYAPGDTLAPLELPEGVVEEDRGPERLVLRFDRSRIGSGRLIEWLTERRPIADLSLEEPPIERVVAEIYRRGLPYGPDPATGP